METPSLFAYATKELSQDAMICWLMEWDRLCFKVAASELSPAKQDELKREWNERITRQHERVVKPKVMRRGNTMTVAAFEEGWLRYDDRGVLDLDATVESLRQAEQVLMVAGSVSV